MRQQTRCVRTQRPLHGTPPFFLVHATTTFLAAFCFVEMVLMNRCVLVHTNGKHMNILRVGKKDWLSFVLWNMGEQVAE